MLEVNYDELLVLIECFFEWEFYGELMKGFNNKWVIGWWVEVVGLSYYCLGVKYLRKWIR